MENKESSDLKNKKEKSDFSFLLLGINHRWQIYLMIFWLVSLSNNSSVIQTGIFIHQYIKLKTRKIETHSIVKSIANTNK